jgi:hypothetical protein
MSDTRRVCRVTHKPPLDCTDWQTLCVTPRAPNLRAIFELGRPCLPGAGATDFLQGIQGVISIYPLFIGPADFRTKDFDSTGISFVSLPPREYLYSNGKCSETLNVFPEVLW